MCARNHITKFCEQHVIPYITRTIEETLEVDNITFIPERKTKDITSTLTTRATSGTPSQQALA